MALVFIVEDDVDIRDIEMIALRNGGHQVQAFGSASEFYARLEDTMPDMVLLDIMLPDEDGYQIIKRLRRRPQTRMVPVIMVTAKTQEIDMLRGLDDGADDYIRKPFSVMELLSRVKALLRRTSTETPRRIEVGGIVMDHERHTVYADGKVVELTLKEYELLEYLLENESMVRPRDVILQSVWGIDRDVETRTVDMHIKTLRQKLGECGRQIRTIRGVGYTLGEGREEA